METMRGRWNALYALGKFCWAGRQICHGQNDILNASHAGQVAKFNHLLHGQMHDFQMVLHTSLLSEHTRLEVGRGPTQRSFFPPEVAGGGHHRGRTRGMDVTHYRHFRRNEKREDPLAGQGTSRSER